MKRRTRTATLAVLGWCVVLTGCASIIHGRYQTVAISSSPTGCSVTIDDIPFGVTPVSVDLRRKGPKNADRTPAHLPGTTHRQPVRDPKRKTHLVRLEMEGYQPFEIMLNRRTSGWVWGNIVFGGFIGLAVDAATGGLYKIDPDTVVGTLVEKRDEKADSQTQGMLLLEKGEVIYVTVVFVKQSGWQQIASMTSAGGRRGQP